MKRLMGPLLALAALMAAPGAASAAGSTVTGTVVVPTGADASRVQVLLLDTSGSEVATATVADNHGTTTTGTFTFSSVANGTYELYYLDPRGSDNVAPTYYGGASTFAGAATVAVAGNLAIPSITLGNGGELSGTFTDPNSGDSPILLLACQVGAPDPAQVAYWATAANGSYSAGKVCEGDVPTSGSYSFGGLVPGASYTLLDAFQNAAHGWTDRYLVDGSSLTADPQSASDFTVRTGPALTAPFSVPALGSISGVATDPGGSPDSGLSIQLIDAAGTVLTPTVTYSAGAYTVAGLLPGAYKVDFLPNSALVAAQFYTGAATLASAATVTVNGGSVTPNINVTLATAAAINGTVTQAQGGAALGGIKVEVVDAQGNAYASAVTSANGTYSIGGLPAGTWYLRFDGGRAYNGTYYATGYYGGAATLAGSAPLVLTAAETVIDVNQALIEQSTGSPGVPTVGADALTGLHRNKAALRFRLTSGSGTAGYLKSFRIKLPRGIGWNRKRLATDLVVTASTPSDTYAYVINSGLLIVTFASGTNVANVALKGGGLTVTRSVRAKARARRLPSATIQISATDTTGLTTSLAFVVKRPR